MNETSDVNNLKEQLLVARREIQNLRKQITSLSHVQRKDIQQITNTLENFHCENCRASQIEGTNADVKPVEDSSEIKYKSIGVIRTAFAEKRAVPRQPTVGSKLLGSIEVTQDTFTNPEHALEGLNEFSHIWIIYHFHKNEACTKSKVAPPRLNGERVGVFGTRSPHRPCAIGLSLVELHKIEGSIIYFWGTDMIDGTPVLDIKPYIPQYDAPGSCSENANKTILSRQTATTFFTSREEPDGEESANEAAASAVQGTSTVESNGSVAVKVPKWIMAESVLSVIFNERAESELAELNVDKKSIVDVLQADPRSVYLRTKYGSQIFTFQLGEVTVTCKFDDTNSIVTVVRLRKTEYLQNETTTSSTSSSSTSNLSSNS